MVSGTRREVVQGLAAFDRNMNFGINFGRATMGELLMLTWKGDTLGRIFMLILEGLHERHNLNNI
jgi:hypothetical protein